MLELKASELYRYFYPAKKKIILSSGNKPGKTLLVYHEISKLILCYLEKN